MAEQRKFGSLEEMRAALGGQEPVATCKKCGKTLKDSKYELCYDCNQQRSGGGAGQNAPEGGQNAPRQEYRGNAPATGGAKLPADYLKAGYFDADGYLREELINAQPQALARTFASINLTTAQLRRFYAHARFAAQRLEAGEPFAAVRPVIAEMVAQAAGAVGRAKGNGVGDYELFMEFIKTNVEIASKDQKAFSKGFVPHFQYIVAYFTYLKPKG